MKPDRLPVVSRPVIMGLTLALAASQLGGCVAAALVPLAAGGTLTGSQIAGRKATKDKLDAQKAAKPLVIVGQGATAATNATLAEAGPAPMPALLPAEMSAPAPTPAPAPAPASDDAFDDSGASAAIGPASAPPAAREGGYAAMTAFVLSAADPAKARDQRKSALLDQASLAALPRTMPCKNQRGALLIDLDTGTTPFDLDDPPSPAPGLAEYLRAIRGTGTAVVWIASLPETAARQLGTILKATGLDPLGIDQVLLLRRNETRKQQVLLRADDDWCVLAIAGDRKADFDEVFDYLRNPDGPVAVALEQNIGAGWFLVPPPIK